MFCLVLQVEYQMYHMWSLDDFQHLFKQCLIKISLNTITLGPLIESIIKWMYDIYLLEFKK